MKSLIVNFLVWALRPVVLKIVSEIPKPETMGDRMRRKAEGMGMSLSEYCAFHERTKKHLTGEPITEKDMAAFKDYWSSMVYCQQGKKQ